MRSKIKIIFEDRIANLALRIFLFFFTCSLLVLILRWHNLPPEVPLYYSLPWGEEQLTTPFNLLILPLSSFFVFFLNFFLVSLFFEKEPLVCKVLILTATIFSFLSTFTLIKIIFLIT